MASFSPSSLACGSEFSPRTAPPLRDPQTFPISWCPGVIDFGQTLGLWRRMDGEGSAERPFQLCAREAAPGRLAVLCVFYWPEISTSCSPLILHRSCFLSPQYLGRSPASPPTGESPSASEFPGRSPSMGFLQISTGLTVQSRSLWLLTSG